MASRTTKAPHQWIRRLHPTDLVATIYYALGINPAMEILNDLKQPRELVKGRSAAQAFRVVLARTFDEQAKAVPHGHILGAQYLIGAVRTSLRESF